MPTRLTSVPIPRTPASSFNKDRIASDLIKNQVRHTHQELMLWIEKYGRIDPEQITTEQQAADYLAAVTRVLHPVAANRPSLPPGRPPKSGISLSGPVPQKPAGAKRKKPSAGRRKVARTRR